MGGRRIAFWAGIAAGIGACVPQMSAEPPRGGDVPQQTGPAGVEMPRVPGTGVEPIPPPRQAGPGDPTLLEQALAEGSNAALIMFLARNPGSPEVPAARAALRARTAADPEATVRAVAGADAPVVSAFDAARLAGTAEAWAAFLAAHGGHPLAAEARYWIAG